MEDEIYVCITVDRQPAGIGRPMLHSEVVSEIKDILEGKTLFSFGSAVDIIAVDETGPGL